MRSFTDKNATKSQLRKEICAMAKQFGVSKVTFNRKAKYVMGTYNALNNVIYIDCKQSRKDMLLTFFHELGHFTAVRNRKWLVYHLNPATTLITVTEKFNIENGVDKIAKQLWNKHVDAKTWGKYLYGYPKSEKKESITWLTKHY